MIVYAIADDGDRFVMFHTSNTEFAHTNAVATADKYTQNVVAYEVGSTRYAVREYDFDDKHIDQLLSHVSISVRSAADWLKRYKHQFKLGKTTEFEVKRHNRRLVAALDKFEETN